MAHVRCDKTQNSRTQGASQTTFDDIDDADDIDDPRTEVRRIKVRSPFTTPPAARSSEGGPCGLRRRVVDVVDVVALSKGRAAGTDRAPARPSPLGGRTTSRPNRPKVAPRSPKEGGGRAKRASDRRRPAASGRASEGRGVRS